MTTGLWAADKRPEGWSWNLCRQTEGLQGAVASGLNEAARFFAVKTAPTGDLWRLNLLLRVICRG
jgi:hypothetical protein